MASLGSIELNKDGDWLVAVQCAFTISGADASATLGLPLFTLVSGAHGSFTILPTTVPGDSLLWAWSFIHTVTSSPETLSFTCNVENLQELLLDVSADYKAAYLVTDDGAAPDATSVIVNQGSKLTILRGTNR